MLNKREIIEEGYRKGLERALKAINETLLQYNTSEKWSTKFLLESQNLPDLIPCKAGNTKKGDKNDWERIHGIITTPIGKVLLGKTLINHFKHKSRKEREQRGGLVAFVKRTLRFPQEIWYNQGNYVFVVLYQLEDNTLLCVAAIVGRARIKDAKKHRRKHTSPTDELHLISYMSAQDDQIKEFYSIRKGKLIYEKRGSS